MDQLPPAALVTIWLDIIRNRDIPINIVNKRTKLLSYYFGSIELAYQYVEENQFN